VTVAPQIVICKHHGRDETLYDQFSCWEVLLKICTNVSILFEKGHFTRFCAHLKVVGAENVSNKSRRENKNTLLPEICQFSTQLNKDTRMRQNCYGLYICPNIFKVFI
jgi:hypothetical protein